jgi:hypothetical protein
MSPTGGSRTSGANSVVPHANLGRAVRFPAGLAYYQRCQDVLEQGMESPSITAVQCYIFTIAYRFQAGLLNRAQVVAGKAIIMAMMLGLHDEPDPRQTEL